MSLGTNGFFFMIHKVKFSIFLFSIPSFVTKVMDGRMDCFDASDETDVDWISVHIENPPAIVHLDGLGRYNATKLHSAHDCPTTHLLCSDELCVPVYLRCNDVTDCIEGEDEEGCEDFQCPGYFKCWRSKVSRICFKFESLLVFVCLFICLFVCWFVCWFVCLVGWLVG